MRSSIAIPGQGPISTEREWPWEEKDWFWRWWWLVWVARRWKISTQLLWCFFFYLGTCSTIAAIASTSWVHPGWDGNNPHLGPHRQHGRGQPRSSQNRRVRSNGSNASFGSIKTIMRTSDLHSFASIKSTSNNDVPNIFSFKTEVPNLHPPSITNLFWAKKKQPPDEPGRWSQPCSNCGQSDLVPQEVVASLVLFHLNHARQHLVASLASYEIHLATEAPGSSRPWSFTISEGHMQQKTPNMALRPPRIRQFSRFLGRGGWLASSIGILTTTPNPGLPEHVNKSATAFDIPQTHQLDLKSWHSHNFSPILLQYSPWKVESPQKSWGLWQWLAGRPSRKKKRWKGNLHSSRFAGPWSGLQGIASDCTRQIHRNEMMRVVPGKDKNISHRDCSNLNHMKEKQYPRLCSLALGLYIYVI